MDGEASMGAHSSMPALDSLLLLSDFWLYFHSAGPFSVSAETAVNCSKQLKYKIAKIAFKLQLAAEIKCLRKCDK